MPLVGVYLDKPGTVPPGKTRCAVGAILQDAQNLYADDDSRSLLSKKVTWCVGGFCRSNSHVGLRGS